MPIQIMYEMYEKHAEYMSKTENKKFSLLTYLFHMNQRDLKSSEGICVEES